MAEPGKKALTPTQVCRIRKMLRKGVSTRDIGHRFGVSNVTVHNIAKGLRYAAVVCE